MRTSRRSLPQHRYEGNNTRAAADKQRGVAILWTPDEVVPDRATQFDFIAWFNHVMHERRNFSVREPFDREFECFGLNRRGRDRVAALGSVAIRCG